MVSVEDLGDGGEMACEIALGPLRDTSTTPGNQDILWECGIRVLDFDKGKLDAALVEILDQVEKITL